ncbi:MAG: SHOCT domain-containing protein [Burkholderiales bacterium]|nr:SHOCT domain-containing protein [Burkholderiales bacterium]
MKLAATRLAVMLLGGLCLGAAAPAHADLFGGLFDGGRSSKTSSPDQRNWVLGEFSSIRLVPREAGSAPNQQPVQLSRDWLRQQLDQVRFAAGRIEEPLFSRSEVGDLVEALVQAFATAGPDDDVLLLSSARRSDTGQVVPVAVTARLFVQAGRLQLIVHDARYEFYNQMRGTHQPPQFTYGSRTSPGPASLRDPSAISVRADWLALPLTAATAANASPATSAAPALVATPAQTPAPAAAPAAASPVEAQVPARPQSQPSMGEQIEQRLTVLKRLHDRGLITDQEYEQKRKEILQQL